LFTFLTLAYQ
jgi:hypothetical protein